MTQAVRSSNIELARIVAMVTIVISHFICRGRFANSWTTVPRMPDGIDGCFMSILPFVQFGTNLFILISGYFGIRLSWRKFLTYWMLCVFYNLLGLFANHYGFSVSNIIRCFFITATGNWFFRSYLWVMLGSVFLNAAIDTLDIHKMRIVVLCGFLLTVVSGWYFSFPYYSGKDCLQLFYMYIVGAYLRIDRNFMKSKIISVSCYVISCILCILVLFLNNKRGIGMMFCHNCPFSIISAVAIFCFFKNIEMKNNVLLNSIASITPAVLLISDAVFDDWIYGIINSYSHPLTWMTPVAYVVMLVAVFFVAYVIEKVRQCAANPIAEKLASCLSSKFNGRL